MAKDTDKYTDGKLSRARIFIMILLAVALISAALILYSQREEAPEAPSQSTTETRPNSDQNSPGEGNNSVTQGGEESDPTTPSSSGTGNNTTLNPDGVGAQ